MQNCFYYTSKTILFSFFANVYYSYYIDIFLSNLFSISFTINMNRLSYERLLYKYFESKNLLSQKMLNNDGVKEEEEQEEEEETEIK